MQNDGGLVRSVRIADVVIEEAGALARGRSIHD
jgi:hypothetical protein